MKKKILMTCAAIILVTNVFGEKISIKTPYGSILVELEEIEVKPVVIEEKETAEIIVVETKKKETHKRKKQRN